MLLVSGRDLTFPPLTAVYKLIIELLLGPQLPSLLDMVLILLAIEEKIKILLWEQIKEKVKILLGALG